MKVATGVLVGLAILLLPACGTTMTTVPLNPHGKIHFVEHRTFMSTTPVAVVADDDGRIVGVTAGAGTSMVEVIMDGAQAGAMIGAAAIIANGLKQLRTIETVTSGSVTTSGTVQTTGTITGTMQPVQLVAPASMPNINLVWP